MKTYEQLTEYEKVFVTECQTQKLLKGIIEGGIRFNDKLNGDDLQARLDKAINDADENETPWFAGEYILETCVPKPRRFCS